MLMRSSRYYTPEEQPGTGFTMNGEDETGQQITSEQMRDVYMAGTTDGLLDHEEGTVHIAADGTVTEQGESRQES